MNISTSKTEVLNFSRNPAQRLLQVGGVSLKQVAKFRYFKIAFTSDEMQDEELDVRSGKASTARAVM